MDIQLYYEEAGKGEPLILLHGNGESQDYFAHQKGVFARGYHVFSIDTRGHGRSPRGTAPFTLAQFAEDLHDFMEAQAIESAHILGFSDGGNIALLFALKYPERVRSLILNGANLYPTGVKARYQLPVEAAYRWQQWVAKGPVFGRRKQEDEDTCPLAACWEKQKPKARRKADLLGLMVEEPRIHPRSLRRLTQPALVIVGDKDMIRYEHSWLIYWWLPNSRFTVLEGDHFVAAKRPGLFNQEVLKFLRKQRENIR